MFIDAFSISTCSNDCYLTRAEYEIFSLQWQIMRVVYGTVAFKVMRNQMDYGTTPWVSCESQEDIGFVIENLHFTWVRLN